MGERHGLRIFRALALGWLTVACSTVLGIDEDYRLTEADAGGGGVGGIGPPVPPPSVCGEYASLVCSYRDPCCQTLYPASYKPAWKDACAAAVRAGCEATLPAIPQELSYHPDMWAACKQVLGAGKAECLLTYDQLYDSWAALAPCLKVVTGKVPPGGPCKSPAECAFIPDPGEAMACVNGVCLPRGKLDPQQPCAGGATSCGPGLYCAPPAGPGLGACKPAVMTNEKCTIDAECGPGAFCEPGTEVCKPGAPIDAPCTQSSHCATTLCFNDQCAPLPVFSPEGCQGQALF